MTCQEIFDKVATHLFTQGRRAVNPNFTLQCQYRTVTEDKTLSCAIGCLIPDEVYTTAMENNRVSGLIDKFGKVLPEFFQTTDLEFLTTLQEAHDIEYNWNSTAAMKFILSTIATQRSLSTKVLGGLSFSNR